MKKWLGLRLVWILALHTPPAFADATGDMMVLLESMKKQMAQMQATIDTQNIRIQQLESRTVLETPQPNASLQPSPAAGATEIMPWLKGAKFGGDIRLRAESFDFYNKDTSAGATDRTRNRFRVRLRWGFEKDFGDDWKTGFRLATGSSTDPTSTNVTLGNPGYFNYKSILVDKAYAVYEPSALKNKGPVKDVKIGAGKFENPFLRHSNSMVWDPDVTPEGVYEQVNFTLLSGDRTKWTADATAGQYLVNENAGLETDAQVFGYQGSLTASTYFFGTQEPVDITGAVSYYDYPNWFQTVTSNTAGTSYLRTNSITADDFRVLDLYPEVAFYIGRTPTTVWVDYAVNTANVGTGDAFSGGNDIHDADEAWGVGIKLGKPKKKGDWELYYAYYEIGANAVVAAFNDSDF